MEPVTALIEQAHKGDKEARDRLVENNMGLIWSIVRRFMNRGYEPEDLFQIGSIGLLKAIDKFDTGYDVKFSTYAVPMITGEIKRFLRDDGMLKVSRTIKENAVKIRGVRETMSSELNREPTIEELSRKTGISKEDVVLALEAIVDPISLYEPLYSDGGDTIYVLDQVRDSGTDMDWLDELSIREAIRGLGEREKRILSLRFLRGKTQMEVAKEIGISQAQVSRLEKGALDKVKSSLL